MFYPWLWRNLPGKLWLKSMQLVLLLAFVIAFLFLVVFPELDLLLASDPTLDI